MFFGWRRAWRFARTCGFTLFSSLFLGRREDVDAWPLYYSFISVLSRLSAAPSSLSLSLMNFHVFHLSQTISLDNHHHHHHSSLSSTIYPLYPYSRPSPAMFVAMFCHYCSRRLQARLPHILGTTFPLSSPHHTHTFFRNVTRTHITSTYPPSGLPQRLNKQKGIRSPTAASRPAAVDTDHV